MNFIGMVSPYPEKTMYFEINEANGYMLADDSYDAFVLVPLWLAMLHKQTLHIRGKVSKQLFQNVKWYIQKIFCDFCPRLSPVNVIVDGFTAPPKKRGEIVGAGISGGVDSLSTLYDHFIREDDPDYRINALFYFDCGILGLEGASDEMMQELAINRSKPGQLVAAELCLPWYYIKSNVQSFRKLQDLTRFNYIAVYSCMLSLSGSVSKYYFASERSYEEIKTFRDHAYDDDMGCFCESYLVPLLQTERMNLIVDGCQYRRVDKLKKIADWDIAQKYLNVCWRYTPDGSNCGVCIKCLRVQLTLEIIGKLDKFAAVFDIDRYNRDSMGFKIRSLQNYGVEPLDTQNVDFAKEHNFPMPECHKCFTLGKRVMIFGE